MQVELAAIRACFEGGNPSSLASADADGVPNVVIVSQVEYVDAGHLALSFQFFNKTRRNILVNPYVQLMVVHPQTGEHYRISARYLHTESEGPLFERMKAKLAGIASHTGMAGVFKLLGADLYEVQAAERVPIGAICPPLPARSHLPALRRAADRLAGRADLEDLFDRSMQCLAEDFAIEHAMLLLPDPSGDRLYTVATTGYPRSGVGAEVAVGEGVIGVAARSRTAIRINHLTQDTAYCRTVGESLGASGDPAVPEREIAYPGLPRPHSQMALPMVWDEALLGLLFVESAQAMRFDAELEDALAILCRLLGAHMRSLQSAVEAAADAGPSAPARPARAAAPAGAGAQAPLRVRYFEADGSVFLDDDYLIKGVAGSILWTVLNEAQGGRLEFSNRELRLSERLRLPDLNDNLEARLVLLRKRLAERSRDLRIEKSGRGRFKLLLQRDLQLHQVPR